MYSWAPACPRVSWRVTQPEFPRNALPPPAPSASAAGWCWRAGRGRPPSPLVRKTLWNQKSQFDFHKALLLFKHCILSRSRFAFSVPSWSPWVLELWLCVCYDLFAFYQKDILKRLVLLIDAAFPPSAGESTATPENNGLPDPEGPIIAPSPGRLSINPLPRALGPLGLKKRWGYCCGRCFPAVSCVPAFS